MTQVKKQSALNLLINYVGFGIGGMNYILLMPLFFATFEIGLIRLLISLSNVWVSLARLGTHVSFVRFFAHYRTTDRRHSGFVHWMYLLGAIGMLGVTLIYVSGRPWIYEYFINKSALFVRDYYFTLIPFALVMLFFSILESQASAIQRTVLSNFLREVLLRFLFTISIFLFAVDLLDLRGVIWLQILGYGIASLWLALDLSQSKLFSWRGSPFDLPKSARIELTRFSVLMMLTASAQQLVQNLDSMMLGAMAGLDDVGVYAVYLSIATLVVLPERSLIRILFPVVSEALAVGNWLRVKELYVKSALLQLIAGLWVFGMLWSNESTFYLFLKTDSYRENFSVFVLLGLAYLANMSFGINNYILLGTRYYRIETALNLILLLLNILFNYLLILRFGAIGAAGATLLSIIIINLARWVYIRWKFEISPFTWRNLAVVGLGAVLIYSIRIIPQSTTWYFDLIGRSMVFTSFYFGPLLLLRIAPELNHAVSQTWQFLSERLKALLQ